MDTAIAPVRGRGPLTRLAGVLALALVLGVAVPWAPASLLAPANALDSTRGYDGPCTPADSNGVTVVIDFQQLDGNDGRSAPTIVRCSPVEGNDASIKRTGLQALVDAGIVVSGTVRWGDNYPTTVPFVCRVEGRPAADEPMHRTASDSTYVEACGNTPPGDAYWSYWHANGQGGDWTYSDMGVMNRNVTPGGYEGWSFSLNRAADDNPVPRVTPVNPTTTFTFAADKAEVEVGQSVTLSWNAEGATHVVASGAWNGTRLAQGSETLTPTKAGTFTYTLTTAGLDPPVERSVTITVTGDDTNPDPETPPTTPETPSSSSTYARQTASWLASELSPKGQMPGPNAGTDWGLTIDTLWALYAAGTGATASKEITTQIQAHAGEYLGADLYGDKDARIGGSTAKLLVAAIVAGKDPEAFGTGRFLPKGQTYDLRAETLALLDTTGAQKGRIGNRGTGSDDTNIFAQSLAVIGLSRSGGVPADAVDFLVSQQCAAGFFRMFYADKRTCDAAQGVGDVDGTAMGIQALMTARDDAGVSGLDDEINAGLDWLMSQQASNGSFGGGVGTSAANSNSTGLAAQTLAAGAEYATGARATKLTKAYEKSRDWLLTVHAHQSTAKGTQLDKDREYGAIAYNKSEFTKAKSNGISTAGRDQWRRASAQAIFGLAPVSFADLGKTEPIGDTTDQNHPDKSDDDDKDDGGSAAPPPGTTTTPQPVAPAQTTVVPAAATPTEKLAAYLSAQLVEGDHIEVTLETDGEDQTYVDYDATADVWFALRSLGGQEKVLRRISAFLLHPKSINAYAHGAPYDTATAAYAEPLAKLALIARQSGASKKTLRTVSTLDDALNGLGVEMDGRVEDKGTYADHTGSVARYAWITMASTASDGLADDSTARLLLDAQCGDGTFPEKLSQAPCESGDPTATALAVQALNTLAAPGASTEPGAPNPTYAETEASNTAPPTWLETDMTERAVQIQDAALAALAGVGRSGLPLDDAGDNLTTAAYATIRQAAGLDVGNTATALLTWQRPDGGFTATATSTKKTASELAASIALAPVLARQSWIGQQGSPLITAVHLPLAPTETISTSAATDQSGHSTPLVVGIALAAVLLGLLAGLLGPRTVRRFRRPDSASPEAPNEVSTP